MENYNFTQLGYEDFLQYYLLVEKTLQETTDSKAASGAGSDTWHDEGFKIGIGDEMMWSQNFGKLQVILKNSKVVIPKEQDKKILLGNGVFIETDGQETFFFIDGYLMKSGKNRISINSPLGQSLLNKKVGDEFVIKFGSNPRKILVKKIILPSEAIKIILDEKKEGASK
ncbi:MAG: GreA/GreB family elongation factor [Candidatus Falkowbacteria bacterium]|nr:GreA/GreB family elongation factor [Candidatus Falkowbacteria bacterium]